MNNRNISEDIYKFNYSCAIEKRLIALDREEETFNESYPQWDDLDTDMKAKLIKAIDESFDILIESIYGGGHYNDTDMLELADKEISGYILEILDN